MIEPEVGKPISLSCTRSVAPDMKPMNLARPVRIFQNSPVMTMHLRDFREMDREALIALWEACGLIRSWNNPNDDIDRAVNGRESTILVGYVGNHLIGSIMAGHDGQGDTQ